MSLIQLSPYSRQPENVDYLYPPHTAAQRRCYDDLNRINHTINAAQSNVRPSMTLDAKAKRIAYNAFVMERRLLTFRLQDEYEIWESGDGTKYYNWASSVAEDGQITLRQLWPCRFNRLSSLIIPWVKISELEELQNETKSARHYIEWLRNGALIGSGHAHDWRVLNEITASLDELHLVASFRSSAEKKVVQP